MPVSGNHGRSSADQQPSTEFGSLVTSTTPQQSVRGFVAPTSAPIKKTPDINDIIGERVRERRSDDVREEGEGRREEGELLVHEAALVEEEGRSRLDEDKKMDFSIAWSNAFEQVFSSIPTIYIPLKEILPKIENNSITVNVKNDVQKEHFEAKTRDLLSYLRTHFDEKVENIVVETNEQLETKKIIYDAKDKLQNFKEQNGEFEDFIQILDLKIKD